MDRNSPVNLLLDVQVNYALSKTVIADKDYSYRAKNIKYSSLSAVNGFSFSPFITDSLGNLKGNAEALVHGLVCKVVDKDDNFIPFSILFNYWRKRICCAILKEQSDLLHSRYWRAFSSTLPRKLLLDEGNDSNMVNLSNT